LAAGDERAVAGAQHGVLELEHDAAGALRLAEAEAERAVVARLALDPLHLLELLDPRLDLARLRRLVAEALDEALHPRDLALLLLDRPPERDLARGALLPPGGPGAGEE